MKFSVPGLRDELKLLRFIWKAAKGYHFVIVVTLLAQMGVGLLPAAITYYIQRLVGDPEASLTGFFSVDNLLILFGCILLFILLKEAIAVAQSYAMINIKRNIEHWYLARLTSSDYATVHDRLDNRNVIAITRESDMVTRLLPIIYKAFFGAPITILAFIALLLVVSPKLTLVVSLLMGVVVACAVFLRKITKRTSRQLYDRFSDMHVNFTEWLRGYKIFKLYGASEFIHKRLDDIVDDTSQLSKKLTRIQCTQSIVVELLTYCVVIVFLCLLSDADTATSWQALISFPAAIIFIRDEAMKITRGYSDLTKAESSSRRLMGEINAPGHGGGDEVGSGEIPAKITEMALDDVTFSYPDSDRLILDRASMSVKRGSLCVFTGDSGSGKSTTFDLLMGLRRPCGGRVLVNGVNINDYDHEALLRRISYVEQEPFIFEGTLIENICFGQKPDMPLVDSLLRELRLDHISESLATDGKNLSAGERQRVAFVRAMVKRPDVVLLDETTSSVDAEATGIMLDFMRKISRDHLVVCISHDQRVIDAADYIINLKDGKIEAVARG